MARILLRLPKIFGFAWRFLLRVLLITTPILVAALLVPQQWLTNYDMNCYLAEKPTAFIRVVVIDSLPRAATSIVLIRKVLGCSVALPTVLFSDITPGESFARSEAILRGQGYPLLLTLAAYRHLPVFRLVERGQQQPDHGCVDFRECPAGAR